ncbi:hypothetical protein PT287_00090 [Lactobacillus sp. ESL0679]|nr:hypothetical protein [Lactobacillus sp. ESL0679]
MHANFLKQQTLLNRAYLKQYILCSLITLLIALSTYANLQLNGYSDYGLLNAVLARFTICIALVPTLLISVLATTNLRINDALRCQTRKILFMQIIYRVTLIWLLMILFWLIGNILVVGLTNTFGLLSHLLVTLLFRSVYLWLSCYVFGLLVITLYLYFKNKIVAFFIVFIINGASFSLNTSSHVSLFYDFIAPNFAKIAFAGIPIMLGILCILMALLMVVIEKRDF